MPSEHTRLPYYMANYSRLGSVPRCSDRLIQVCNTSCFRSILQYPPDTVNIRVPANRDQLCGHVFAHLKRPNCSKHCFRQQIKVSWHSGYLSGRKCSRSTVPDRISCFSFKTISVTDFNSSGITNVWFLWPNYGYCYSLRKSKYLNGPDRSFWSIVLVCKITNDVDYQREREREFWTVVWVMLSVRVGWPNCIANYSHRRSVPRCLCAWKCSDRIIINTSVQNVMPSFHFTVSTWYWDHKSSASSIWKPWTCTSLHWKGLWAYINNILCSLSLSLTHTHTHARTHIHTNYSLSYLIPPFRLSLLAH